MDVTYWNPTTKRRVDVTEGTPLPVGGGVLGEAWDGDPGQFYGVDGTINERLGLIQQYTSDQLAAVTQDPSSVAGVVAYQRGYQASEVRSADGAFADDGFGNTLGFICAEWAFCVYGRLANGNAQAPTAWDVRLEASLNAQSWTEILAHTDADANGVVKWVTGKPALYVRYRVAALTLGSANNIVISVVGRP